MALHINQLSAHVGVEITGITPDTDFGHDLAVHSATLLARHGVVVYRDAHLDDDTLLSFSARFGTLVASPTGEHRHPEIQTITMHPGATNPVLAAYRRGNFLWHIDGATDTTPQKGTFLSARAIDDSGQGGTQFASTYAAYAALSAREKAEIEDLQVVHSFAAAQGRANPDATPEFRERWASVPERVHPLVWKRADGCHSLLLGATAARVVGWSQERSDDLLQRLLDSATQPQFVIQHEWREGDLVTWDNTGMLHRAMPFEPTSPRLLHRTTLVGELAVV